MTLIEMLNLLVEKSSLNPSEKRDAHALITELKNVSAFSTVALSLEIECIHEFEYVTVYMNNYPYGVADRYWLCKKCKTKHRSINPPVERAKNV